MLFLHTWHNINTILSWHGPQVEVFTGPLALGVLDHSRVTEVDLSTEIYPPIVPPGAVLGLKVAAL